MHHLLFDDLVKELAPAAERGVTVRVLVNAADRGEIRGNRWQRLFDAGGIIRFKQTNEGAYQIMHHKLVIIDDSILVNGSGNWSGSVFTSEDQNLAARLYAGTVAGTSVDSVEELEVAAGRSELSIELPGTGRHFVYAEIHEPGPDRMAWTAPIWIEVL